MSFKWLTGEANSLSAFGTVVAFLPRLTFFYSRRMGGS
jgi:hypothetical protein